MLEALRGFPRFHTASCPVSSDAASVGIKNNRGRDPSDPEFLCGTDVCALDSTDLHIG
jgi:hypothetical protein